MLSVSYFVDGNTYHLGGYDETGCNGNPKISQMLEDRGMIEHPICPVSRLDCKLTDYTLFVRYKKLS